MALSVEEMERLRTELAELEMATANTPHIRFIHKSTPIGIPYLVLIRELKFLMRRLYHSICYFPASDTFTVYSGDSPSDLMVALGDKNSPSGGTQVGMQIVINFILKESKLAEPHEQDITKECVSQIVPSYTHPNQILVRLIYQGKAIATMGREGIRTKSPQYRIEHGLSSFSSFKVIKEV